MKRPCRAVETPRLLEESSDGVAMKKVNSGQGTGRPFELEWSPEGRRNKDHILYGFQAG